MPHELPSFSSLWVMPWNAGGLSNESVRRSVELSSMAFRDDVPRPHLRSFRDLCPGVTGAWRRKRTILFLTLIGLMSLAIAALHHRGLIRPMPAPAIRRFRPERGVSFLRTSLHRRSP